MAVVLGLLVVLAAFFVMLYFYANVFVKGPWGVRMVSVIKDDCAIVNPDDDMTPPTERPGANATVGMFLDYLDLCPKGVRLSMVNPAQPPVARDSQEIDFASH